MSDGVTRLAGRPGVGDLLVLGAGLGTTAATLWAGCAPLLDDFDTVGLDLPGHGGRPPADRDVTVAGLARHAAEVGRRLAGGRRACYAGVSLAGAVGLELARERGPFRGLAAFAAATTFGTAEGWHDRAALVRRAGSAAVVDGSRQRWFAPGFAERDPATADRMLNALAEVDGESYARCCEALASFDARGVLVDATVPVLLAPGEQDVVVTPDRAAADAGPRTQLFVVPGCAHQPPAEAPKVVAVALREFVDRCREAA